MAVTRQSMVIEKVDVVRANTVLHHTEQFMPDAYGEYGMSRNSAQIVKILKILDDTPGLTHAELWAKLQSDFDKIDNFVTCVSGMCHAGKIQNHSERIYPVKRIVMPVTNDMLDYGYLSKEEL